MSSLKNTSFRVGSEPPSVVYWAEADPAYHLGRDRASYFGSEAKTKGPKSETKRAESGGQVLVVGQLAL